MAKNKSIKQIRQFGLLQALLVLLLALILSVSLRILQRDTTLVLNYNQVRDYFDAPLLQESSPVVIAYAISVTECQPPTERLDQAAVLLYSIHRQSIRNPTSGSNYDYRAYAFVHPNAASCSSVLTNIGYDVSIKESPVLKEEIRGDLKLYIHEASCCQEKEYLKLYSYTLLDYPIVVHLDLDCLVLQPLDDLFDSMLGGGEVAATKLQLQWNHLSIPSSIEAYFTRDYNLVNPGVRQPHQIGIQGGFIVVRPDLEIFQHYLEIIREGNYTRHDGWGGRLQYGGYYGAAQIQGLMSYYFGAMRPNTTVELNRCYYNFMGDDPRRPESNNRCRTLEKECQDCRKVHFHEIKSIHFTICAKPWWCHARVSNTNRATMVGDEVSHPLCLAAHAEWFRTRLLLEQAWSERDPSYKPSPPPRTVGNYSCEVTLDYCRPTRPHRYDPMTFPNQRIDLS